MDDLPFERVHRRHLERFAAVANLPGCRDTHVGQLGATTRPVAGDVEHQSGPLPGLGRRGQPGELLQGIQDLPAFAHEFVDVSLADDRHDGAFALDVEIDVTVEVQDVQQAFQVVACGVTFRDGVTVTSLIEEHGRIAGVRTAGEEMRARFVVSADGAHAQFSIDRRPKRTLATIMGWWENFDFTPNSLDMIFDKNVAPLYGWMFPEAENRVNIGICIDGEDDDGRKQTRPLREVFQQFLDDQYGEKMKKAKPIGKWKGHPISYTTRVANMTMPGALVLGEAARMTHLATGEGIFQAMQSGIFAADTLADVLSSKATEAAAWKSYVWKHQKRFTVGIAGGLLLRAVVDSPVLDGVARLYNNTTVRKGVVRLLGSALAGSNVAETH